MTMERVAFKIPEKQKNQLEQIAENEGYPSRSELFRELVRDFLNKRERLRANFIEEIKNREKEIVNEGLDAEKMASTEEIEDSLGINE